MNSHEITSALLHSTENQPPVEPVAQQIAKRLIEHLRKTHQLDMLPEIIAECERATSVYSDAPLVTVASEAEIQTAKDAISTVLHTLETRKSPVFVVDPTLIQGFVVTYKGKRTDRSAKTTLLNLYQSLSA
jgi:F0F1-type ATP synthase delta subunit